MLFFPIPLLLSLHTAPLKKLLTGLMSPPLPYTQVLIMKPLLQALIIFLIQHPHDIISKWMRVGLYFVQNKPCDRIT
jgi:hypothetical protein